MNIVVSSANNRLVLPSVRVTPAWSRSKIASSSPSFKYANHSLEDLPIRDVESVDEDAFAEKKTKLEGTGLSDLVAIEPERLDSYGPLALL